MPTSTTSADPRPLHALSSRDVVCFDCYSSLSAIVAALDVDGNVVYGNAPFAVEVPAWRTGCGEAQHLADLWPKVAAALPDLSVMTEDDLHVTHVREVQLAPGEHDPRDHLIFLDPLMDSECHPNRGWTLTLVDISHIRQAERSSRDSLHIEMFLSRLSSRFVGRIDHQQAIETSLEDIGQLTSASRVFYASWDQREDGIATSLVWQTETAHDLSSAITANPDQLRAWYEAVLACQEIVELDDLADELPASIGTLLAEAGDPLTGSLLMVPLVVDDTVTGVVGLRHEEPSRVPANSAWIALDIFSHIIERVLQLQRSEDALHRTNRELQEKSAQLVQSEKMASIGQMAAGIAHEINNPVGFIMSNLSTLGDYLAQLKAAIECCRHLDPALPGLSPDARKALASLDLEELAFMQDDLDDLVDESLEGCVRVRDIVQNLKGFARLDDSAPRDVQLEECVESTLKIVWNELKYRCTVVKEYGETPAVTCFPGKINQVIMNLLVNAAQSIAEQGTITITTLAKDSHAVLKVADTGCGIPAEKVSRIFDPFFTSKAPGEGTGLGLYICHNIVEEHGGSIAVESTVDSGSTFTVRLPYHGKHQDREDIIG